MKVHKKEYLRTTIYVHRERWRIFNEVCLKHKTTTCHVLDALVTAMNEGEKLGVVDLGKIASPNPVIINISHTFLGKPRSPYKVNIGALPALGQRCPVCGSPMIREFKPSVGELREGRCLKCPARWLISPGG